MENFRPDTARQKNVEKAFLLLVLFILALGACGGKEDANQEDVKMWQPEWEKQTSYLHKDDAEILNSVRVNEDYLVYSVGSGSIENFYYIENQDAENKKLLVAVDRAETDILDYKVDRGGSVYFLALEAREEDNKYTENIVLKKYDPEGNVTILRNLNDFHQGGEDDCYLWQVTVKPDGNILVYSHWAYILLSEDGEIIKEEKFADNEVLDITYVGSDALFLQRYVDFQRTLSYMEPGTGKTVRFPNATIWMMSQTVVDSTAASLLLNESQLFSYDIDTAQLIALLRWSDYGIVGDNIVCAYTEDGNLHCVLYENNELLDVTYTDRKTGVQKQELVLGSLGDTQQLRKAVAEFNRTHSDCMVTIVDYGSREEEMAVNQMYNDILRGKSPDIIQFDPRYANDILLGRNGMLEDLNEYLENSRVITKKDIVNSIYQALLVDGKLYMLPTNFFIETLITKKEWTEQDMLSVIREKPDLEMHITKDYLLECGVVYGAYGAESSEIQRTLDKYMELAEFCPDELIFNPNDLSGREGRALADTCVLDRVDDYLYEKAVWGEDSVFAGFPEAPGNGMAAIPRNCFGISSKSSHKELAWEFIESFFSDAWKETITPNYDFSVCEDVLEKQFQKAMKRDYYFDGEGNQIEIPIITDVRAGVEINVYAAEQGDIDDLRKMIDGITIVRRQNTALLNIVLEEASYYFSGAKDKEEVRKIINNRINTLLQEE